MYKILKNNLLPISNTLKTINALGLFNIFKVVAYRLQCKTDYFKKRLPIKQLDIGPLFYASDQSYCPCIADKACQKIANQAKQIMAGQLTFFSRRVTNTKRPPDWFCNPFSKKMHGRKTAYWSQANDPKFGDIKIIWEISRMDWALVLSKMYAISRNNQYIQELNYWLIHWNNHNMPQTGPNWVCAQEAAIRLIQVLLCAHILNQKQPLPALIDFVSSHCRRIALTRHYANAQQNNHAISEAAALFIGGMWLNSYSTMSKASHKWERDGRQDLERLVQSLIADDGSFAQHSINYHRLLISTLSMVEFFRRSFNRSPFSSKYLNQVTQAIFWIYQMVDPKTGNAPNLGGNDGARVYALSASSYTDYRPEIQLASCLIMEKRLYPIGHWDEPLQWLQFVPDRFPNISIHRKSQFFPDGGYVTFAGKLNNSVSTWGLVRCPTDHFRPHHADAFHFDLWVNGRNVLRDSGSYSYDISDSIRTYYISSSAHNTASFDRHDQMPVLSRFLYGQWIKAKTVQPLATNEAGELSWCGAYTDYRGCKHQRHVLLTSNKWRIVDKLSHFYQEAVVRWRLIHDHWTQKKNCLTGKLVKLTISTDVKAEIRLTQGLESLYYMDQTDIPVLKISVSQSPATVVTEIDLVDNFWDC